MRKHLQNTASLHYYPFGMAMVGYKNEEFGYSYGMNGQEKEDEIYEGAYSAEYWLYDSRTGRRGNPDPRPNPSISVYACFANNPIWFSDVYGDSINLQKSTHTVEKGDTYWDLAKNSDGAYTVDDLKAWNPGVNPNKLQIGQNINISDPNKSNTTKSGNSKSLSTNKYVITNPDLEDHNLGQYAANKRPGVSGNVPFTTYITPTINGNNVNISGRVEYFNSLGDPIGFSAVAFLYGSNGELVERKPLNTNLDYSYGGEYFVPQGWIGETTFKLMDANDIKAHNYSVKVETTGTVRTPAGGALLTIPGTLFLKTNYGVNGFDIEIINE